MKRSILSAKGLCKSFAHNGGQVHIISDADIEIYEGDFTVIMGASGSGKSTLMYALSGMDRATSGTVMYDGSNIAAMSEKELARLRCTQFGFVFQQIHLVSNLSIYENIITAGFLGKKRTVPKVKERASELLEKMNISHIRTNLPSRCSGGEQQRCAIARALINDPVLLFADEPTGALNRRNTTEVLDLLTDCNRSGQSILMVTHDMRAALRASRILYIEDGRITGELTLPPYTAENEKSREAQVNSWLNSLEW
ncbi:MAG: ABC transporter ATP-binding protein [Oscillospiraceae bacterium]|nr:ABC transporter ATP-binding protein [Oscillospiraceae bacterium]